MSSDGGLLGALEALESSSSEEPEDIVQGEFAELKEKTKTAMILTEEISSLAKQLTAKYSKRFPEIGLLRLTPVQLATFVQTHQNSSDDPSEKLLQTRLFGQQLKHSIAYAAATSKGQALEADELQNVLALAEKLADTIARREQLVTDTRIAARTMCPALSELLGPHVAARLLVATGGAEAIAAIPSSNLETVGRRERVTRRRGEGGDPAEHHFGYIAETDLALQVAPQIRRNAVRILASKATLAARVDATHKRGRALGAQLRAKATKQLSKLVEPPPQRPPAPLKAPRTKPKQTRAGRRFKARREARRTTDLMKKRNQLPTCGDGTDYGEEQIGMAARQAKAVASLAVPRARKPRPAKGGKRGPERVISKGGTTTSVIASGLSTSLSIPAAGSDDLFSIQVERERAAAPLVDGTKTSYFSDLSFSSLGGGPQ